MSGRRIARSLSRRPGASRGVESSNRRTVNATAAPTATTSPGVSLTTRETASATRTASVTGRLGRCRPTQTRTGREARTAKAGPTDANVRRAESSSRSPMSASTAPGPSPTASVTWLDPPSAASRPTSAIAIATTPTPASAMRRAPTRGRSARRASVAYAASSTSRPPPSAPNRLPATATSASAATAIPARPSRAGPSSGGEEEERLEEVRDAVEASRLGRPERRERDGLGVEAEDEEIRGEHGGAREPERQERRGEADEGDDPPAREPEVRGQRDEDHARRQARGEDGHDVRDRADEDAERQPDAVVPLDPFLEPLQGTDRVVAGDHLEAPVRDVGERDEPVDPRRVGGEEAARPRRDRDRVAVVLAPAGRWEDDERRRRRTVAELDARLGRGRAAEQRALHLAGQERVEGALAGDGRACAGNGEPDRPRGRRSARAGTGRRRRPQRSQEPRARAPRRSLRGRGARRESCRPARVA